MIVFETITTAYHENKFVGMGPVLGKQKCL